MIFFTLALIASSAGAPAPAVVCHSCDATVTELHKSLGSLKHRSETDVFDAIQGICAFKNFRIYDFPPPKMTTGCKEVMDQKEEAFERAFYANPLPGVDALKRTVCADICDSVSSSDKTSRKPEVFVNGEPVDTNARGDASEGAVPKKKTKKKRRKKTKKKKKKAKKKAKEEL